MGLFYCLMAGQGSWRLGLAFDFEQDSSEDLGQGVAIKLVVFVERLFYFPLNFQAGREGDEIAFAEFDGVTVFQRGDAFAFQQVGNLLLGEYPWKYGDFFFPGRPFGDAQRGQMVFGWIVFNDDLAHVLVMSCLVFVVHGATHAYGSAIALARVLMHAMLCRFSCESNDVLYSQ